MRPTKEEMKKYNTDYSPDTDFSAFARLLQSKWRNNKGYEQGKLGNYLELDFSKKSKANYLTDKIKSLVTATISEVRENKGLIGEPRIWNNLLSSQPLCFNLFGELHYDLNMATRFFCELFPSRVDKITSVKFEYSPGRGDNKYLGDHSAFDVFIEYVKNSKKGFIGIEVKYAESLKEETKEKALKNLKERYIELTNASGLFKENAIDVLQKPPLSQIWRDHLLSLATRQDYEDGFFVYLFPAKNKEIQNGVNSYISYFKNTDEASTGFYFRYLENFIEVLNKLYKTQWATELKERYLG